MNDTNIKKKKSSKQKRVLIASIVLASVIMVGSTFAWFTSQDEVTNKLTASSNYGVSIVEDFTPPSNWVPGQEVNKKVGVTNTGNIDAFVKLSLSNFIDITVENTSDTNAIVDNNGNIKDITDFTNAIELYTNRNNSTPTGTEVKSEDEVKSIQAGSRLVYAPFYDNSKIEQNGNAISDKHIINNRADRIQGLIEPSSTSVEIEFNPEDYVDSSDKSKAVETELQKIVGPYTIKDATGTNTTVYPIQADPTMTGLYVWERAINPTTDNTTGITTYHYSYAGYYYDASTNKYYAVDLSGKTPTVSNENTAGSTTEATYTVYHDNTTSSTATDDQNTLITSVSANLRTTKTLQNQDLTFSDVLSDATNGYYITATYKGQKIGDTETEDDVIININLHKDYDKYWHFKSVNGVPTFYYEKILSAGTSVPETERPIQSLKLADSVTEKAYLNFDYNLNITADSVQVIPNNDGTISSTTAESAVNNAWQADSIEATYDNGVVIWTNK